MSAKNNQGFGFSRFGRNRGAMLGAAVTLALAGSAFGQLFMDQNGTASGLGSGAVTWSAAATDWATTSGGTTDQAWVSGDLANFNAAFTVTLADQETAKGLSFNTGGTTITTTGTLAVPAGSLNIGSNTFASGNAFTMTEAVGAKQIIAVPLIGSGDLVLTSNQSNNGSNTIDLAGNMSQFTGNIYMLDTTTTTQAQYQLDEPTGSNAGVYGTIYLDNGVGMTTNNQVGTPTSSFPGTAGDTSTGTLIAASPDVYTISNNIVLNYKGVANNTNNTLGAANGPTYTIGGVSTNFSKIVTYAGAISSAGTNTGLVIGGSRGTTILANSNNTYTGNTTVSVANTNGMLQLGAINALPATSQLIIGTGSASIGPTDLDGNNQTFAGLSTGTTAAAATTVGNIYNLTVNNSGFAGGAGFYQNLAANPSTITITPVATLATTFHGDIGDTNLSANPFNDNEPYSNGVSGANNIVYTTANTNVSLVLNGAANGGTSSLTLSPVGGSSGLLNGNEYAGTTTINNNATLVFGRGYDKLAGSTYTGGPGLGIPGTNYTITGNGAVTVNSGGTISSVATDATHFIGGAGGTINLMSGSKMTPGGAGTIGTLATGGIQFNAGASMTFDIASGTSYDYMLLNGGLSLDDPTNSNHVINIGVTSAGIIPPGDYNLINAYGGVQGNVTTNGLMSTTTSYSLGTTPAAYSADTFNLTILGGNQLQLQVTAPVVRWDPTGQGVSSGYVTEEGAEWTDGNGSDGNPATYFVNELPNTEVQWSNTSTNQVLIGDDATQNGGPINLGNNIIAAGGIEFGPIAAGFNYSIINSGSNAYTLTVGSGGIAVANSAATSTTPSAEIDVPIILSASQTWTVPSGQFLNVTGKLTETDSPATDILTVTGGGVVDLSGNNGSIGTLAVNGGSIVLLSSTTAIGNAAVSLNNGGVEFSVNGSPTNAITIGTLGGALGATTGYSVVYSPNINTANGFEAIGTGTTTFNGSVTVGTLQVAAASGSTLGTIHFSGNVTDSGNLSVTGGNAYFDAVTSVTGTSSFTGGNSYFDNPNAATTPNTFTGGITIAGGTVYAQSSNALGNAVITFPGATTGGLDIAGAAMLSNPLNGTGSGAAVGGTSYGDTVFIDTTHSFTLTGATMGTGDLRWYADPNNANGASPTIILDEASQRPGGGAVYFNIPNLTVVIPNDPNVNTGTAMGLSTQSFMSAGTTTLDVEAPIAASGDLRGEPTSTNGAGVMSVIKTGPGLLTLSGSAGSSTSGTLTINNGEVAVTGNAALGGQTTTIIAVNVNGPTSSFGLDISNGTRTGGAYTLNNGGILRRDNLAYTETFTGTVGTIAGNDYTGESDIVAATAADVITVSGTGGTIEDGAIEGTGTNAATTNTLFSIQNAVVVNTGATLNLQNDNTGGNDNSYIFAFRGPTNAATAYDTITIQAGATIANTGPGQLRFGRTGSQGMPIIAQGIPGSEALLQLGAVGGNDDVYMTDNNTATGNVNTIFVVAGTGTAGLRIEAPMDATYEDPTSGSATPAAAEGTTGFFGVNATETASGTVPTGYYGGIGNAYTVMSANRLAAISSTYTVGSTTVTPSGTLTLAANDAGSATGTILGGPAAACAVSLALDNTSGSGGTHVYQINPAANSASGTFANFAGLTVERTYAGGAGVTAQLLGTTLVPTLSITGGAKVDITNQALVVDSAAAPPTATIAGYLTSAYDSGNWDGPGIGSSSVALVRGTSIGYAQNNLLSTPYTIFGGQTVDTNAVLVKYTWLGDLNLDGVVDSNDFAMMGDGQTGWIGGDLNYDGVVNSDDWALFMLGAATQTGQLTSAVPEPATMSLLAIGAGAMLRRKRRI